MITQYGNVTWDTLCENWEDNTTGRVWNCLVEVLQGAAGVDGNEQLLKKQNLNESEKKKMVNLYVRMFYDHLTPNEKALMERAGIRNEFVSQVEVNKTIDVVMKSKKIVTENIDPKTGIPKYTKNQVAKAKTIDLVELLRLLNLK